MGVRSSLALPVDARALVLNDRTRLGQRAIRLDREGGDAAVTVISHQEALSRRVHRQVAGSRPAGRLAVQQGELARLRVPAERADGADRLAAHSGVFARRIKEAPSRMECQETRARSRRRQLGRSEPARGGIETRNVNAFALSARVGADIDRHGARGRNGFGEHGARVNKPTGKHSPNEAESQRQLHGTRQHNPQPVSTRKHSPASTATSATFTLQGSRVNSWST